MHFVNIERRVLWVSLHSNDPADWGRYIHQNAFELVIGGNRLDLNDNAETWHFEMSSSVSRGDR
jgi:hypothetical protein